MADSDVMGGRPPNSFGSDTRGMVPDWVVRRVRSASAHYRARQKFLGRPRLRVKALDCRIAQGNVGELKQRERHEPQFVIRNNEGETVKDILVRCNVVGSRGHRTLASTYLAASGKDPKLFFGMSAEDHRRTLRAFGWKDETQRKEEIRDRLAIEPWDYSPQFAIESDQIDSTQSRIGVPVYLLFEVHSRGPTRLQAFRFVEPNRPRRVGRWGPGWWHMRWWARRRYD